MTELQRMLNCGSRSDDDNKIFLDKFVRVLSKPIEYRPD